MRRVLPTHDTHDDYRVGWVCVLPSELNASRALLDEEHDPLPAEDGDDNGYLLGRMGKHNVVIVYPSAYGTSRRPAAEIVANMLRTFRNVRFALMVGVGGGVPKQPHSKDPRKDIRLGDVVVSVSGDGHGGVIQYDIGKWEEQGKFKIESHLNNPPQVLLNALRRLQSDHGFEKGQLNQYMDEVFKMNLRALEDCEFPGQDQDRLFKADYRHVGGEDCSACDVSQIEKRLERNSNRPEIHHGIIASGNAVMKSAKCRDELREAWGVSCFEMEAAGLTDNFPCVVIRGICDYSDSHKNEIWQPYAAVAAAAYAKDLLRVIQPWEVESTEAVPDILKDRPIRLPGTSQVVVLDPPTPADGISMQQHEELENRVAELEKRVAEGERWMKENQEKWCQCSVTAVQPPTVESERIEIGEWDTTKDYEWPTMWPTLALEKVVSFEKPFAQPPRVMVAFGHIDVNNWSYIRMFCHAKDVTNHGMTLEAGGWHDTRVYGMTVRWMAIGV